ncbi:MAG: serine protease [Gammaproteobacteria bacterium]|nr:serine protease [Gammaproteobacteria bacterium]
MRYRRHACLWGAAWLLAALPALAIVNGTVVSETRFAGRYPWAVALVGNGSGGVCTAQLIAPEWVLTAAHCAGLGVQARVGASDRDQARVVKVAEAFRHPRYDSEAGTWDIGLLRLAEPVAGPVVTLATAADAGALLREKALAAIAGWGKRAAGLGFSVPLVESEVELRELRREESRFIFIDRASGPCGGDSGGPLLLRRADGSPVLVGIASRVAGNLCAQGGGISLYADVAAARGFIAAHVPELAR